MQPTDDDSPWKLAPFTFEKDVTPPSADRTTNVLLRHPTVPFERRLDKAGEVALWKIAAEYLEAVNSAADLGLPDWWVKALGTDGHPLFGWLPLHLQKTLGNELSIRSAFTQRVRRQDHLDRTLILLAGERVNDFVLGSEFGLRVVAHLQKLKDGSTIVRITGLTASLPYGAFDVSDRTNDFWLRHGNMDLLRQVLNDAKDQVAERLLLDPKTIVYRGYRLGRPDSGRQLVELRGRGCSNAGKKYQKPFEFLAQALVDADLKHLTIISASRISLVACASGRAPVFKHDPASQGPPETYRKRRPTRSESGLHPFCVSVDLPEILEEPNLLTVAQSWFVPGDDPHSPHPKRVPLPRDGLSIRSNDFTALSTFRNIRSLFDRMKMYGIPIEAYFQFAQLPLKAFYRSGIRPGVGKNGRTVNGQVRPQGWAGDEISLRDAVQRPSLEIHLAVGDLSTRARWKWECGAEPLGFAADPRWIWHELGHVLCMAALGELEFRFAHSPGDALAAIIADPASQLSDSPDWRGLTFPWIFTHRRHDRSVSRGWSWSGSLGRPLRNLPDDERLRRKGYWSEQLLSTSLFRLYRCLGGDTMLEPSREPDRTARKRASDHTVYLIMMALRALGDQRVVAANRVEAFVSALRDVDEGLESCRTVPDDENPYVGVELRIGGCARKVIRWAFEAQGLYPVDETVINNGPGQPEAIDIYIRDRRPFTERTPDGAVHHGPGTYVPVSLDWRDLETGASLSVPEWFASDTAIRLEADGVHIEVGNRGRNVAQNVEVSVWYHPWPVNAPPPLWGAAGWTRTGQIGSLDVTPDQPTTFGPFALPSSGRYLVFSQATCPTDRANTDIPMLACYQIPTPLDQVVPWDNNLGLAVIEVP